MSLIIVCICFSDLIFRSRKVIYTEASHVLPYFICLNICMHKIKTRTAI